MQQLCGWLLLPAACLHCQNCLPILLCWQIEVNFPVEPARPSQGRINAVRPVTCPQTLSWGQEASATTASVTQPSSETSTEQHSVRLMLRATPGSKLLSTMKQPSASHVATVSAAEACTSMGCKHQGLHPVSHLLVAPMISTCPRSFRPSIRANITLTTLANIWSLLLDLRAQKAACSRIALDGLMSIDNLLCHHGNVGCPFVLPCRNKVGVSTLLESVHKRQGESPLCMHGALVMCRCYSSSGTPDTACWHQAIQFIQEDN